jgi:hypothetical protein
MLIREKRVSDDAIKVEKKDRDVSQMVTMFKKDQLNLFPKYQRGYTWDASRASRLMVTALCGRTIPPVYLHEKKVTDAKGKQRSVYDVVDGKQRLSSLIAFSLGEVEAQRRGLQSDTVRSACQLSKLDPEEYDGWNGMRYEDLSRDDQERFDECHVITITIPATSSEEEVFSRYEDINSGSDNLSKQQVRRAVFYGAYMDLIDDLRASADFLAVRDAQELDTNKEEDGELVLRLLAFASRWHEYKTPRKAFLNDELRHFEKRAELTGLTPDAYLDRHRSRFLRTVGVALRAFGKEAVFRKWDAAKRRWVPKLDATFAELMFAALFRLLDARRVSEEQLVARSGPILEAIKALFESADFKPTLRSRVGIESSLRQLEDALVGAAGGQLDAKRAFALGPEGRRALWERQGRACTICGALIREEELIDGHALHVDHVVPHALGGATDDANAALTHRACNLSKGSRVLAAERPYSS